MERRKEEGVSDAVVDRRRHPTVHDLSPFSFLHSHSSVFEGFP